MEMIPELTQTVQAKGIKIHVMVICFLYIWPSLVLSTARLTKPYQDQDDKMHLISERFSSMGDM